VLFDSALDSLQRHPHFQRRGQKRSPPSNSRSSMTPMNKKSGKAVVRSVVKPLGILSLLVHGVLVNSFSWSKVLGHFALSRVLLFVSVDCSEFSSVKAFQLAQSPRVPLWLVLLVCCGCGSTAAPLSIEMYNPETKQTLTCAARDQLSQTDPEVLAGAVESCAQQLESRGFVRAK